MDNDKHTVTYSINDYDRDGDKFEDGVYIHHKDIRIRFDNIRWLIQFRNDINKCIDQISDELKED